MNTQHHWDQVYQHKAADAVSWFRPHLERSLSLIEKAAPDRAMSVIDVGGGESTLVDDLLAAGYRDVSVLDISQTAMEATRQRLGPEGPAQCSGLDVVRYDTAGLHSEFGAAFQLVESATEVHETPSGTSQQFIYCYCVKAP